MNPPMKFNSFNNIKNSWEDKKEENKIKLLENTKWAGYWLKMS